MDRPREPILLTDAGVRRELVRELAIGAIRADLLAAAGVQSPRRVVDAGGRRLVVTGATDRTGWLGVRIRPGCVEDNVAVAWDAGGHLVVAVVGMEFGIRRTGAVGAVATDALARQDARVVGVIGSGRQAWGQLWGVAGVRSVDEVRVYSPTLEHVVRFVDQAGRELGIDARPAPSAHAAVDGADVVILATNAGRSVVDAGWIGPGAHVTTIGPKSVHRHETPTELVDAAAVFAVDHLGQVRALDEPFFSTKEPVPLAMVLAGSAAGRRTDDDITVFCSAGLPTADLALLRALAEGALGGGSAVGWEGPTGRHS